MVDNLMASIMDWQISQKNELDKTWMERHIKSDNVNQTQILRGNALKKNK